MAETIKVTTRACPWCRKTGEVEVNAEGYHKYAFGGMHIQNALHMESADIREQILTGTHPKCWDEMFPDEEED